MAQIFPNPCGHMAILTFMETKHVTLLTYHLCIGVLG